MPSWINIDLFFFSLLLWVGREISVCLFQYSACLKREVAQFFMQANGKCPLALWLVWMRFPVC
jgi:hypothetical protein